VDSNVEYFVVTINVHLDPEVERRFRAAVAEENRTITDVLNEILADWALDHSYARLAEWRARDEESQAFDAAMRARRRDPRNDR
jgi:ParG